jgi:hypothetical protein
MAREKKILDVELLRQELIHIRQAMSKEFGHIREDMSKEFKYIQDNIHSNITTVSDKVQRMDKEVKNNTNFRNKVLGALIVVSAIGVGNLFGLVMLVIKMLK